MQQLYGARGTDTKKALFFFAASSYSKAAIAYADEVSIGLFTYDPVGEVTVVNARAAAVLRSPKIVVSSPGWDFGLISALVPVVALILMFILTI